MQGIPFLCAFLPTEAGILSPKVCPGGRYAHEKSLSAPLRPAPRAGQRPAAGGLPAGPGRAGPQGSHSPCPGRPAPPPHRKPRPPLSRATQTSFFIEDLSTGEVQQVPKRGLSHRGRPAAEIAPPHGRTEALQGADRRGPQLRALLPRPRLRSQRQLALCRPGAAAGLPDRRRPPQLLGGPTTRPTMPVSRPSRTPSSATSSAMAVRRQGRAILPSPMAVPRPARTSGAAHSPTSSRWTAAPTSPPTTTKSPSPFLPRRCSSFFPQDWASLPTLPRRNAGSVRRP